MVDDDRDSARTLSYLLRAAGFDTGIVGDRSSATRVALGEQVSVVLSSFAASGIGATTDLVAALRSRPEAPLRDSAIVAIVDDPRDADFGLSHDADAVLVRPVSVGQIADAVTEVASLDPSRRRRRREVRAGISPGC